MLAKPVQPIVLGLSRKTHRGGERGGRGVSKEQTEDQREGRSSKGSALTVLQALLLCDRLRAGVHLHGEAYLRSGALNRAGAVQLRRRTLLILHPRALWLNHATNQRSITVGGGRGRRTGIFLFGAIACWVRVSKVRSLGAAVVRVHGGVVLHLLLEIEALLVLKARAVAVDGASELRPTIWDTIWSGQKFKKLKCWNTMTQDSTAQQHQS